MNSQGEAILQDLNSRNGTLLNGYRISEPMVLALGDIITIGTFQIFYREVTDTEADRLPAKMNRDQHTQAISTYTDMSGMVGNLNQIGLVELFRTLEHHKKTGILNILPSQGEGYVEFYEGDVRRCHFKTYQALPAVFQLLQETEGFFRFVSKEISPENPEIRLTTEQVLFEYSRYLDEDLSSK
jgi:pSer/pThr/pTyr-binding forkhead associated (FHA) protein